MITTSSEMHNQCKVKTFIAVISEAFRKHSFSQKGGRNTAIPRTEQRLRSEYQTIGISRVKNQAAVEDFPDWVKQLLINKPGYQEDHSGLVGGAKNDF